MKVLLINANTPMDTLIPPNLAILSACLKEHKHDVKLFDTTFYPTRDYTGDDARVNTLQVKKTDFSQYGIYMKETDMYEDFVKMVKEYKPDIIGLSSPETTYVLGISLLKKVKDLPLIKIVGGAHSLTSPDMVINEDCVDIVCIGEGFDAFPELCNMLEKRQDYTKIKGLWFKKNGKIIKNPHRDKGADLDKLPFQDWTIFAKERRWKPMGGKIRITGEIEFTRGCPFKCTYCCNELYNRMFPYRNYRERSVERFMQEAEYLKKEYNMEYIYVLAASFLNTSRDRLKKFFEEYKKRINLPFFCDIRTDSMTEEYARLLEDAGCEAIAIGIESGSPDFRKRMLNRVMTNEKIIKTFEILRNSKIRFCANNIIGFPGETREDIFETIELNRKTLAKNVMVHLFNPYHGTSLRDYCIKHDLIKQDYVAGDYRADAILDQPQLSREEVLGLQRTFVLYVKFPKERWPEIKIAEKFDEKGNKKFEELKKEFTEKFFK